MIQIQKRFNCSKRFRMMDSKPELIETIFSTKKSRSRFRFGEIQRRFLKCAFCDQKSEKNIKFQEFRNFDFNPKKSFFEQTPALNFEFEFECLSRDGIGRTSPIILSPRKAQVWAWKNLSLPKFHGACFEPELLTNKKTRTFSTVEPLLSFFWQYCLTSYQPVAFFTMSHKFGIGLWAWAQAHSTSSETSSALLSLLYAKL